MIFGMNQMKIFLLTMKMIILIIKWKQNKKKNYIKNINI